MKDIGTTGLSVYFPTSTNCLHGYYKKEWKKFKMKTNQENRLVSGKGYSTVDHLQTINKLREKCNEFKRPPCIDYENAFDSIEHKAIFKALKSIGINETFITILEDICTASTARVHMDYQVSEEIPILRIVRQGDPISSILFTATIQGVFKMTG